MKKLLTATSIGLLLALSSNCFANEQDQKRHSVGLQLSAGGADYKNSSADGDGVAQMYTYYNYQFSPLVALEVGINGGVEADDWECKEINNDNFDCRRNNQSLFDLEVDDLAYKNFVLAAKTQLQISQRNSFYGKLGANYFDYELSRGNTKVTDDSGLGLFAELGWQYRWDNGIGMNVGYQVFDMKDLDTYTITSGISYRF